MPPSALFSELLGYTSIACWLGAQLPQVLENLRRKSCDGLALPFLANWFLGDFSNLMGCILTHQLPFQTYLATYFVSVDSALLAQFIYYQYLSKPQLLLTPTTTYPQTVATSRSTLDKATTRYRTLSVVAANVAAAAALAAQQDSDRRRSDPLQPEGPYAFVSRAPQEQSETIETDIYGYNASGLADSFHSEGGRATGKRRVSWSIERHHSRAQSVGRLSTIASSVISHTPLAHAKRGRSLGRNSEGPGGDLEATVPDPTVAPSMAETRRNSRAGRRSATMVFLGAWVLFGVGTFARNHPGFDLKAPTGVGRVLSPTATQNATAPVVIITLEPTTGTSGPSVDVNEMVFSSAYQDTPGTEPLYEPHHSTERILGRIFAWLCTTLYLTSRLPQIWKNYVRKSVEGLSMYLFVFAFLGNVFYVASILFSPNIHLPPPRSTEFLRESIPYLLGSAGTLMFDITIVTQSFIYKPKHRSRSRSTTTIEVGTAEESSGLLSSDALAKHHYSTSTPTPSSHVDRYATRQRSGGVTLSSSESDR